MGASMREETTPAVQRAFAVAEDWAKQLGCSTIGPTALLLGLIEEEEGHAAQLLIKNGATLHSIRERLLQATLDGETDSVLTVQATASQLARDLNGERTIRSEHLLLALLHASQSLRDALADFGVSLNQIESEIKTVSDELLSLDEPLEFVPSPVEGDIGRILDASANRAREAMRVVEDYCRFVLDDAFLSREIKSLRHELTESLSSLSNHRLISARDTLGDVGTSITTAAESDRSSLLDVVHVNLKRLQEALRSLEEYGKVIRPELGRAMEKLRYRTYTLERSILLRGSASKHLANAKLYLLLTGSACAASLEFVIAEAVAGGVDIVQLREKSLNDTDLLHRARQVRRWTKQAGAIFIVNDRPDIAALSEADGVHLGQDDLPIREARRIVGADAIIGVSTHSMDQLRRAILDGASYVGIGPVFASPTKHFDELPGLDFIRQATVETSLPAFALGGITLDNLGQVLAAGATRIAVSSAICSANEPRPIALAIKEQLGQS
jgi:thiamine-phosphate pyrophosphorylase